MPQFTQGDLVKMRNDPTRTGRITSDPEPAGPSFEYRVFFEHRGEEWVMEDSLDRLTSNDAADLFVAASFAGRESLLRSITYHRLIGKFADTIMTRHASKIDYLPYQWLPLLKVLNSSQQRLLIADEVGLGKTIEAGIIQRELAARLGRLDKVLIIARAGELNRQWESELKERFDLAFEPWSGQQFAGWLLHGQKEGYWTSMHSIVGRHSLQRDPSLTAVLDVCTHNGEGVEFNHPPINLDLLILDESHHVRNRNNLHTALKWLVQCARTVLFLSATPIHLQNDDLYNQLRLLLPKRFANRMFFDDELERHQGVLRGIRSINNRNRDEAELTFLRLADEEDVSEWIEQMDGLDDAATRVSLIREIESFSPLSNLITRRTRRDLPQDDWPQRHAISRRHTLNEEEKQLYRQMIIQHYQAIQDGLPFGKTNGLRLAATCMPIAMPMHQLSINFEQRDEDSEAERGEISLDHELDLTGLAQQQDSRFNAMWNALSEFWRITPDSKVIIFSFFVDVLEYLSIRLTSREVGHVVVHGRNPTRREDRYERYDAFRQDPNVKILLSSEVGTEGLNLQVADTIVNYNLPWNPMVVEQRIGRIDRRGQQAEVVRIVNLYAEGTIEDKVISRLLNRVAIFESSIGDMELILGDIEQEISNTFVNPYLSDEEINEREETLGHKLEMERLDQLEIERAARDQLIANLPFDPVEQAMREGRAITPEQIRLLIEGFIITETPHSKFGELGNGVFEIKISQDLLGILTLHSDAAQLDSAERGEKERGLAEQRIKLTFDADKSQTRDTLVVAPGHWLLRIITSALKATERSIHPASAVSVPTNAAPPGLYAYGVYRLSFSGLQEKQLLVPVLVSITDGNILTSSQSNEVLHHALVHAYNLPREHWPDVNLNHVLTLIQSMFHTRREEEFERFSRETERFKKIRRKTEKRYARNEISNLQATISRMEEGTPEQRRILPALRQRVTNTETALNQAISHLESLQPAQTYNKLGFGIISVVPAGGA